MTQENERPSAGALAILAPTGRDAATIENTLGSVGIPVIIVDSLSTLCKLLRPRSSNNVAGVLVAEEVFSSGIDTLVETLNAQAPWSDLPIVVLTARAAKGGLGGRLAFLEVLGNVTLLDRPLHAETLQSAARSVLRARARQFQTRTYLEALQHNAETLEERVEERTNKLMAVEETLRQSQKMEAIGQLTGGIAHDFNNLLTGILGSFQLLKLRLSHGNTAGWERYINAGQISAERAAALTHRLLAFSRRQTLDPKPTDVNTLIHGLLELVQRTLGPQISVQVVLAADLTPTLCDPPQLESALLNLCINARDAMPHGGKLIIATANAVIPESPDALSDEKAGSYIRIAVTDTGTGMPPAVLARAFEPFFTTKPLGQGTGLGLAMLYGFAKQSGGHARIESAENSGTTIRLFLPQYDGALLTESSAPNDAPRSVTHANNTVLIVDDEEHVRMVIADILKDMNYTVIEAVDGPSGLALLQSNRQIDLLVSDIGMPGGINGLEMAEAGRQDRPDLKVLFVTGYASPLILEKHRGNEAIQVLRKPFSVLELIRRVEAIVAT